MIKKYNEYQINEERWPWEHETRGGIDGVIPSQSKPKNDDLITQYQQDNPSDRDFISFIEWLEENRYEITNKPYTSSGDGGPR